MALSRRLRSITTAGLLCVAIDAVADDAIWSRILEKPFLNSPIFSVAVFDRKGESGLQLATVTGFMGPASSKRLSIGIGYDDMVGHFQNLSYGIAGQPAITEQLFLFQTPCDKRFQLTLQLRW